MGPSCCAGRPTRTEFLVLKSVHCFVIVWCLVLPTDEGLQPNYCVSVCRRHRRADKKKRTETTFPPSVVTANHNNLLHSTCELKAAALRGEKKKKMKLTMVLCLVVDENFRAVTELSRKCLQIQQCACIRIFVRASCNKGLS